MEYLIFNFSYFCCDGHFEKPQERKCITKFPVIITDSYSIDCELAEKYKFVDLWKGCMMGLPRLQPAKLCIHDGPEIMILGCFLEVSWQNYDTNNNSSHTILVSNES